MSLFRTVASVLLTNVLAAPIELATSIVLARALTVEDRGLFALTVEFAMLGAVVAELGWTSATIYRLRRIGSAPPVVFGAAAAAWIVVTIVWITACIALRDEILNAFFAGGSEDVFAFAVAGAPAILAGVWFSGIARGLDRFRLHNLHRIAVSAAILAALGIAVVAFRPSVEHALIAWLGSHIVTAAALALLLVLTSGAAVRGVAHEIGGSIAYGLRNYVRNVLLNAHQRLDVFLLAFFVTDPSPVAVYAVAIGVVNRLQVMPMSIALAMFPAVAELSPREAAESIARVCRHAMLWTVVGVVALATAAPILVSLVFGAAYEASVVPLLVLLPGVAFLTLYLVLARYFAAQDLLGTDIAVQLLCVGTHVALSVWLVPHFGVLGAAVASTASYVLLGLALLFAFIRITRQSLHRTLVPDRADLRAYVRRIRPLLAAENRR